MADHAHQVLGVAAVVDGEGFGQADPLRAIAQQPRADRVEGAGPGQRRRLLRGAQVHHPLQHRPHAPLHFQRRAARERQEQHALGVRAVQDQVRDPVRQRIGLARARSRDHQQGAVVPGRAGHAELGGLALGGVEVGQGVGTVGIGRGRQAGRVGHGAGPRTAASGNNEPGRCPALDEHCIFIQYFLTFVRCAS
jgi:hypothetical protein